MSKLNLKGFGTLEALLIVVIIGLLGGVGWYVYQRQHEKSTPNTSLDSKSQVVTQETESSKQPLTTNSEQKEWNGIIEDWGVKIKLRDAAKVTYQYLKVESGGGSYYGLNYDSDIALKLKEDGEGCTGIIRPLMRSKTMPQSTYSVNNKSYGVTSKRIGDFYFFIANGGCDEEPLTDLQKRLETDLLNIEII